MNNQPKTSSVYIPSTMPRLEGLFKHGSVTPESLLAFTITPEIKEKFVYDEEEQLDHVAFLAAADGSLRLLSGEILACEEDKKFYPRRVVISARVQYAKTRVDLDDCAVELSSPVTVEHVDAIYIDTKENEPLVVKAAEVIDEADLGSDEAQNIIDDMHDKLLAWYSVQEVPFLLDLLEIE